MSGNSYIVTVNEFGIRHTRAPHNDTDYITLGVATGFEGQPQAQTVFPGNVNNGDHPVNLMLGPFVITEVLKFAFGIANLGNRSYGNVEVRLNTLISNVVSDNLNNSLDVGTYNEKIHVEFQPSGCDGAVAADKILIDKNTLDSLTANSGSNTWLKNYNGVDSANGCGSNSKYSVTFSVSKQ